LNRAEGTRLPDGHARKHQTGGKRAQRYRQQHAHAQQPARQCFHAAQEPQIGSTGICEQRQHQAKLCHAEKRTGSHFPPAQCGRTPDTAAVNTIGGVIGVGAARFDSSV
jgi:hypothetical protein